MSGINTSQSWRTYPLSNYFFLILKRFNLGIFVCFIFKITQCKCHVCTIVILLLQKRILLLLKKNCGIIMASSFEIYGKYLGEFWAYSWNFSPRNTPLKLRIHTGKKYHTYMYIRINDGVLGWHYCCESIFNTTRLVINQPENLQIPRYGLLFR